jgi:hypothetical protein
VRQALPRLLVVGEQRAGQSDRIVEAREGEEYVVGRGE